MKTQIVRNALLAIAAFATIVFTPGNTSAQNATTTVVAPAAATGDTTTAAPELSYGVKQVMKMVQAKVSDSVIVNYVQGSGIMYHLSADEIIYLKQQGMSDAVLNAMLTQRSRLSISTEPPTTPTQASATQYVQPVAPAGEPGTAYVPANGSSMVYVIPSTQSYGYYNSGYPVYYPPYYYTSSYSSSYWPAISFGFGYYGGSCYHGGYYCGHGSWCGNNHWGGSASFHGNNFHGSSVHVSGFSSGGSHGGGIRVGGGWHH